MQELIVRKQGLVGDVIKPGVWEVTEVQNVGDGNLVWCRQEGQEGWQCLMGKTVDGVQVGDVGQLVETGRMWLTFQKEV